MLRAPDWTGEEFKTLLTNPNLSSDALSQMLPRRSRDAVEIVRQGVHKFHEDGDSPLLSEMMRQQLRSKDSHLICALCKEKF